MLADALAVVAAAERTAIGTSGFPDDLQALALVALSGRNSVLAGDPAPRWARLPLLACASVASSAAPAVPLAVAIEFQAAAYSVLDDLEDGDNTTLIRRAGPALALNMTTALLALAQCALLRVPMAVGACMANGWLAACAGQQRDLTLALDGPDPLGAALLAAEGKTAGVVAAALEAGAVLGGADPELASRYRRFGHAIGLAGQFANDLLGLTPGPDGGTDVSRGQTTLPILFALDGRSALAVRTCLAAARQHGSVSATSHTAALEELTTCGAHRYVWTLLQVARDEALTALAEIARSRPVQGSLDRLLPPSSTAPEPWQ